MFEQLFIIPNQAPMIGAVCPNLPPVSATHQWYRGGGALIASFDTEVERIGTTRRKTPKAVLKK